MRRVFSKNSTIRAAVLVVVILTALVIAAASKSGTRYQTFSPSVPYQIIKKYSVWEVPSEGYAGVQRNYLFYVSATMSSGGEVVGVYVTHQYMEAWVNGRLAFRSEEAEERHMGHSPGGYWAFLPLETGKNEVRMISTPVYKNVRSRDPYLVHSSYRDIVSYTVVQDGLEATLAIAGIVLGVAFSLSSFPLRLEQWKKNRLLCVGMFTLCCGLWRLMDLRIAGLALSFRFHPTVSGFACSLSLLGLLLMPMWFCGFLLCQPDGNRKITVRLLFAAAFTTSVTMMILQLLNIRDLQENILFLFFACVLMLLVLSVLSLWEIPGKIRRHEGFYYEFFYLLLTGAGLLDVLDYLRTGSSLHMNLLMWITTVHVAALGIFAVADAVRQENRITQAREDLADARIQIMLSQIQPHFLYNTLNVIQDLCHENPAMAEQATVKFARYLRENMDSLMEAYPVPFSHVLAHTRTYLELEQMRFGDQLRVRYDIGTEAFKLPALTLQPIVENAVRHGIRKREDGGTVSISTRALPDHIEITVTDDGVGFDAERVSSDGRHVGIKNVRERLRRLCGGELRVKSTPGAGTEAMIILPLGGGGGRPPAERQTFPDN